MLSGLVLFFSLPAAVQAGDYTYITNNGALTITGYTGPGGDVTIPANINGYPVTSIGDNAFYLSSVTRHDSYGRYEHWDSRVLLLQGSHECHNSERRCQHSKWGILAFRSC